jgi:pyridinium-3,5-biscarboxylic acid mononucleotide sulfurtransferase
MHEGKIERLRDTIKFFDSAIVAFSGGVDSVFLARIAGESLKGSILLVTVASSTYPGTELDESKRIAVMLGLPQRIVESEELDIPGFSDNGPDRCYFCKKALFSHMRGIAESEGFNVVLDGANADDRNDYRPGARATKELGIRSPLAEVGFTKNEIRECSRALGLPTAEKPALACLASRFPYGENITREKLRRVEETEKTLHDLGFTQLRVRSHGDLARIELTENEIESGWKKRAALENACKNAGFIFVAIDTQGYRTGAMNESLHR